MPKTYFLKTDKPHVLQFRTDRIELEANGSEYIGLRFLPRQGPQEDVRIYMADSKVEECLLIRAQYQ